MGDLKLLQKENVCLKKELSSLKNEQEFYETWLEEIKKKKSFKLWQIFNRLKKLLLVLFRFLKIFLTSLNYFFQPIYFFSKSLVKKLLIKQTKLVIEDKYKLIDGVSFIIPTWNKREMVTDCIKNLSSLLEKESLNIKKEIIVIDNGSIDKTKDSLLKIKSKIPIKVIRFSKNLGFGKAVNIGVKKSKFNYVYLLNNDMFPKKGFLNNVLKLAQQKLSSQHMFFGISSQIFFYDKTKRREESGKTYIEYTLGQIKVAHCVEDINLQKDSITAYPGGGSSLINKRLFLLLGGFDYKSYTPLYCEDLDLGFVAWKLGFASYFCPNSIVIHHHRSSSKNLNKDPNYYMFKNWITFIYKNLDSLSLIIKHMTLYPIYELKDSSFKQYLKDVSENLSQIYKSRINLYKYQTIYKDKELINFIKFESNYDEK